MICVRCASSRKSFPSEIVIHFFAKDGLDRPLVRLSPKVEICFNCGTAEFFVPDKEGGSLSTGRMSDGRSCPLHQPSWDELCPLCPRLVLGFLRRGCRAKHRPANDGLFPAAG
jgi:hypothetical protein